MNQEETLFEIRKEGERILTEAGIDDPSYDAMALLMHCFAIDRVKYGMMSSMKIPKDSPEYSAYRNAVRRRAEHVPLQHLTGRADFMGLSFYVTPDVLIPRFDSEILVQAAAETAKPGMNVLDLCTGSGCLLLALMKEIPGLSGTGCDLSSAALKVAETNAEMLGISPVKWLCGDLFDALPPSAGPFDIILTNPPYIETAVIKTLSEEVREHEPYQALDGGTDGLTFYRRILRDAGKWLFEGGMLIAEIGYDQAEKVKELFEKNDFTDIRVLYDLGGNARAVQGSYGYKK
ncbi:MAG: peptide chain release factor N(5)-glutamine methyltransferase [Lachnospiraceae bacterium]|nr:peptide chain release factor N(5)-glutamine methyltransferase [Lachnospiraceae bacterium]